MGSVLLILRTGSILGALREGRVRGPVNITRVPSRTFSLTCFSKRPCSSSHPQGSSTSTSIGRSQMPTSVGDPGLIDLDGCTVKGYGIPEDPTGEI